MIFIIYPMIDMLLKKVDNKFILSVIVAKRAKQLISGSQKLTKCDSKNPVTVAANELDEGRISFTRTQ